MPTDIVFLHPAAAWLLLALPLLWWPRLRKRAGTGRARLVQVIMRSALMAGLVAALMQPALVHRVAGLTQVLVIERAAWVQAAKTPQGRARQAALLDRVARPDTRLVLIEIGTGPALPDVAARLARLPIDRVNVPDARIDLALDEAAARIPPGATGRVTVVGAGVAQTDDWGRAVAALVARKVAVDAVPLDEADVPATVVQVAVAPVRVGEEAHATVTLAGRSSTPLRVALWSGSRRVALSDPMAVAPGLRVMLGFPVEAAGFVPLRAGLVDAAGTPLAGSLRDTYAAVQDPLRVLYLGERQQGAVPQLQALLGKGFAVDRREAAGLGADTAWAGWQAVMIDDLPAARLSGGAQQGLLASVAQAGTGLFFTGGAASFAQGGWNTAPLARALPVTLRQDQKLEQPSVALVVVVDTSGSMVGEPLDLAKQVARYAVGRLTPADSVGVVEFYGAKQWAVPLQPASDVLSVERAIGRMQAQGSSILYPAIQEAYFALKGSTARYKHILVITDAGVEEQRYQQLLMRAAQDRIAVSTALVGADLAGEERMAEWARWGHGRYYAVPDSFSLVDIDLRQPQIKPSPAWRDGAFGLTAPAGGRSWQGMRLAGMPPLSGYVPVGRRPEAETLLTAGPGGDPVLATWQWGLGRITSLATTPLGEGTRGWQAWPGYGAWLGQLMARTARQQPPATLSLVRDATGATQVLARQADPGATAAVVHLATRPDDPHPRAVTLAPRAPHVLAALAAGDPAAPVLAEMPVGATMVRAVLGAQQPGDAPYRLPLDRLARLTGGQVLADPAPALAGMPQASDLAAVDLSRWCALLSLMLYLAELVWRRLPPRRRAARILQP